MANLTIIAKSTISGSPVKAPTSVPPLKSPESSSGTTETTPNATTPVSMPVSLKYSQASGSDSPTSIKEKGNTIFYKVFSMVYLFVC